MSEQKSLSGWKRFWQRGGWWRSLLLVVVYYGLYQLGAVLLSFVAPSLFQDPTSAAYVLGGGLAIAWGGVLLVFFALSLGWGKVLFSRQPIRGGWWMWIAVAIVSLFNILRFATIDYGDAGFSVVAAWLLTALFVGFAEEVLTRGFVVNLMRKAGYREIVVALASAGLFALLHAGNLLNGQALFPTLFQLVYTFGFGICMYLALRVTGNLIWPILLHASTDPSIFLQTSFPAEGALTGIAGLGNIFVIGFGLLAIAFIRGRASSESLAEFFRGQKGGGSPDGWNLTNAGGRSV